MVLAVEYAGVAVGGCWQLLLLFLTDGGMRQYSTLAANSSMVLHAACQTLGPHNLKQLQSLRKIHELKTYFCHLCHLMNYESPSKMLRFLFHGEADQQSLPESWQKTPNLRKGPLAWGFAAYCGHSPCIQSGGSNKKSLEDVGTIAIATLIRHHLAASPVSTGDHWQSLTFIPRTTTAGCLRSLDMLDTGNLKRLSAVSNCPVW